VSFSKLPLTLSFFLLRVYIISCFFSFLLQTWLWIFCYPLHETLEREGYDRLFQGINFCLMLFSFSHSQNYFLINLVWFFRFGIFHFLFCRLWWQSLGCSSPMICSIPNIIRSRWNQLFREWSEGGCRLSWLLIYGWAALCWLGWIKHV
jgi:hypothetical protein